MSGIKRSADIDGGKICGTFKLRSHQPQTTCFSLPATILVATPPLVAHRHRAFAHPLGGQHKPEARGTRQAAKEARGVCKPRRTTSSGVSASPGRIGARTMRLASPGQWREVPAMAGAPLRERSALPDIDETFDLALQDPMLVDRYPDLPNLWSATVLSWSSKVGPGYMLLSNWLQVIDYLPEDEVFMLFDFVQRGRYVNPARINPKLLQAVMPIYIKNKFRYTVCIGETPAILISTGMCVQSSVTQHRTEGERTVGCIAMVFNERKFHLQIDADAITFGSLSYKPVSREQSNSKALANSGVPSPSSQLGTSRRTDDTGFKTVLGCDDDIPVYDGRHTPFDLNKDVENLAAVLPKYEGTEDGEVIPGSFIAVAYTATSYNNKDRSVAFFSSLDNDSTAFIYAVYGDHSTGSDSPDLGDNLLVPPRAIESCVNGKVFD
ncbi:hypothetical protein C8J57DRAFT_1245689 [Mycena rebaudengoi]|nr:hypothetical protein C8J57DRAFT_1245689 [Mycena rebaudengoi]